MRPILLDSPHPSLSNLEMMRTDYYSYLTSKFWDNLHLVHRDNRLLTIRDRLKDNLNLRRVALFSISKHVLRVVTCQRLNLHRVHPLMRAGLLEPQLVSDNHPTAFFDASSENDISTVSPIYRNVWTNCLRPSSTHPGQFPWPSVLWGVSG